MTTAACDESALPPVPAKSAAPVAVATPPSIEDRSEGPAWYLSQGVPSTATAWSAADLSQAVQVLRTIADRELEKMPRHAGPSGPVFARLVDTRAAEASAKQQEPVRQLLELSAWFEPVGVLTQLYARRDTKGRGFPAEVARVTAAALTLLRLMHDPINKTHPPTEPAALQEYEAGLSQIRTGATKTLMGALLMLSVPEVLAREDRRLLAAAVDRFLDRADRLLPHEARRPMVDQLELLVVRETDEVVKGKLESAAKHLGS
ncbi:MAG TPA: hypothetical protein ENK57_01455 [Polyangiaceae bacterium]|nr:hypothetical protein [Polyangiaceae bacterium]